MPKITFINYNGTRHEVVAETGDSLMRAATYNGVPGIDADCGGLCACATCHVFIDGEWANKIPPRSEDEEDMMGLVDGVTKFSRLSCQVVINENLDGLVVLLPDSQH
jgi:2Fe-2S ferredoxin